MDMWAVMVMKNTVKIAFYIISIVLILALFGCSNNSDNSEVKHTDKTVTTGNNESPDIDTDELVTLETVSNSDKIRFDGTHVEMSIYSEENYYFSNRNEGFYEKFITFLKNTKFSPKHTEMPNCDYIYIAIYDGENHSSFSIYETDII